MRSPHPRARSALGTAPLILIAICVATSATPPLSAQSARGLASFEPAPARDESFALTIESIMRGPEHIGQAPVGVAWSDDGEWVYFRWLPGGDDWHAESKMFRVAASGGEPEELTDEEADALGPVMAGGDVSADGRWRADRRR